MKLYLSLILLITVLTASAKDAGRQNDKPYLVSSSLKSTITSEELKNLYGPAALYVKNGYKAYRITYNTSHTDGRPVVASGAVFVPDVKTDFPMLTYNHGTYFPSKEANAPSYIGNNDELMIGKLFAGAGYLVVLPDYIGYGSSTKELHPYGAYNHIASTVIDMLRAVNEFCKKNEIGLTGKYFYSGWSEGAGVALATVKQLEEKYKGEFTPAASVLNAGPYYTTGFADQVIDEEGPLRYISSYAWILASYNRVYNINKPLSWYFTEPAASALKNNPEAKISQYPGELFTKQFRESYKAGTETALMNALKDNDLWDWKPASTIVFCHGDRDDYVPLFNSEKAYYTMKAKGADVTLQIFKGANHTGSALGFAQQLFTTLEKAK